MVIEHVNVIDLAAGTVRADQRVVIRSRQSRAYWRRSAAVSATGLAAFRRR